MTTLAFLYSYGTPAHDTAARFWRLSRWSLAALVLIQPASCGDGDVPHRASPRSVGGGAAGSENAQLGDGAGGYRAESTDPERAGGEGGATLFAGASGSGLAGHAQLSAGTGNSVTDHAGASGDGGLGGKSAGGAPSEAAGAGAAGGAGQDGAGANSGNASGGWATGGTAGIASAGSTGESPVGPNCGNDSIDLGTAERCDGLDLGDASCRSLGFASGQLGCRSSCADFETSGCSASPAIAVGERHACYLAVDGWVKCWGNGDFGQLGQGDTESLGDEPGEMGALLPIVDLGSHRRVVSIAAGFVHTCALLDDGSLKCWGLNGHGQLGLGDIEDRGDQLTEMGDALPVVDVGGSASIARVRAGALNTCVVFDNGGLKCWGTNNRGQLGLGDQETRGDESGEMGDALPFIDLGEGRRAVDVQIGFSSICALLDNGAMKCWGGNDYGELGLEDSSAHGDEMGDALRAISLGEGLDVVSMGGGMWHRCAVFNGGTLKCWGWNVAGQLGLGDREDRGNNVGEMGDSLLSVDLGAGRVVVAVEAGDTVTCALLDDGSVRCWGSNAAGRCGLPGISEVGAFPGEMGDALPAVDLGDGSVVTQISGSITTMCALLEGGAVKCWGDNQEGQLGQGDVLSRGEEVGSMGNALLEVELGR